MSTGPGPLSDIGYATLDIERHSGAMRRTGAMLKQETRDPFEHVLLYYLYDTSKNGDEGFFLDYGPILLWRNTR